MTKLTKIDVADVEPLLNQLIFNLDGAGICGLLVGDAKKLLDKINPPEPTLVEILNKKMGQFGMPDGVRGEWSSMLTLALKQESKIKELEEAAKDSNYAAKKHAEEAKEYAAIAVKRFSALNKIARHTAGSLPWNAAYASIKQIACDALQEKS